MILAVVTQTRAERRRLGQEGQKVLEAPGTSAHVDKMLKAVWEFSQKLRHSAAVLHGFARPLALVQTNHGYIPCNAPRLQRAIMVTG
eukprot:4871400-Prymnesium_polylepis.1